MGKRCNMCIRQSSNTAKGENPFECQFFRPYGFSSQKQRECVVQFGFKTTGEKGRTLSCLKGRTHQREAFTRIFFTKKNFQVLQYRRCEILYVFRAILGTLKSFSIQHKHFERTFKRILCHFLAHLGKKLHFAIVV